MNHTRRGNDFDGCPTMHNEEKMNRISAVENDLSNFMARQDEADFFQSLEEKFQEHVWEEKLIDVCSHLQMVPGTFLVETVERRNRIIHALEDLAAEGSVELHKEAESLEEWSIGAIYDSLPEESKLRRLAETAVEGATPLLMGQEEY